MTDEITEQRRMLWGVGSPRTMRPHWALHELSLPYQTEAIAARSGGTQTATFAALNPRQKIPVLQDGDFTIAESPAIVSYLAEVYSRGDDVQLLPTQQHKRAQWLEWGFFITMELDATSLYVVRRHGMLKHIYGEAPAAVENAKAYFLPAARPCRSGAARGWTISHGRRIYGSRYSPHDLPDLGGDARCTDIR